MKNVLITIGVVVLLVMPGAGALLGCIASVWQVCALSVLVGLCLVVAYRDDGVNLGHLGGKTAVYLGGIDIVIIWMAFLATHVQMPDFLVSVTGLFPHR